MKINLPGISKLPLTPAGLSELAENAQIARLTMEDAHAGFTQRVEKIRSDVAARYSDSALREIPAEHRREAAELETSSRIAEARKSALSLMDNIAKQQVGPIMASVAASKNFYRSPADTLSSMTIDNERRNVIAQNLQGVGPVGLWHAAVRALQKGDPVFAAAVMQAVNALPAADRPFRVAEYAERFAYEPHEKAIQAINSVKRDTDSALTTWRVVTNARHSPVAKLQLAMAEPELEEAGEDTVMLPEVSE